jgi:predicted enzyme related to lactoylglutathione lyase
MIKPKEIAFTAYGVTDLKISRKFYEEVLGLVAGQVWENEDGTTGFVEYYLGEHTIAIGAGSEKFKPGKNGGTVALEVENFAEAVAHLKEHNAKFLMESEDFPSCSMTLVEDPDGNQVAIHQRKVK